MAIDITLYGNNKNACGVLKLKDAEIYYETYGSGKPLLLLHGNGQSIDAFVNQITEYSKLYKVIAVDTRGQGKSDDRSTAALTYELFASDMKELLDHLKIKKNNILGWSDGGITGLIMAMKYPSYVDKLAVMGANLFATKEALKDSVFDISKLQHAALKDKTDKDSLKQRRLLALLLNEPQLTFDDIKKIKAPTLVMAGEDDVVLDRHTREIARNIPNAELHIFWGADHSAPYYEAVKFNKVVLEFFGPSSNGLLGKLFRRSTT